MLCLTGFDRQQAEHLQPLPSVRALELYHISLVEENEEDGSAHIGDSFFQIVAHFFANLRKLQLHFNMMGPRVRDKNHQCV